MIPNMVVNMNPDGSLRPGMMNFAITPAMNPMMIVQMIPMMPFHLAPTAAKLAHNG